MNLCPETTLPPLALWLERRGLDNYQAADLIGCSGEYVRRMCLPFENPRRCKPTRRMALQIERATGGEVGVDDWSAPAPAARANMVNGASAQAGGQ